MEYKPKLTKHIIQKLIWSDKFTRSDKKCFYSGRFGSFIWDHETDKVYYRDYNVNYNGGIGDCIGTIKL